MVSNRLRDVMVACGGPRGVRPSREEEKREGDKDYTMIEKPWRKHLNDSATSCAASWCTMSAVRHTSMSDDRCDLNTPSDPAASRISSLRSELPP